MSDSSSSQELGNVALQMGLTMMALVFIVNAMSTINKDLNREPGELSTEAGTTGMIILLVAGFGLVAAINGLQGFLSSEMGQKYSKHFNIPSSFNIGAFEVRGSIPHHNWAKMERYDSAPGMARFILGDRINKRKGYDDDHDYSWDEYRHREAEIEAERANKLSIYYNQQKIEREKQIAMQHAIMMNTYQPQPLTPVYQNKPVTVSMDNNNKVFDQTHYGIILLVSIIFYLGAFFIIHENFFYADDGSPRQPSRDELNIIEIMCGVGAAVLSSVTYFYVDQLMGNFTGISAKVVALFSAVIVGVLSFMGSTNVVQSMVGSAETPSQCNKFKPENFYNDPDYLQYKQASEEICVNAQRLIEEERKRQIREETLFKRLYNQIRDGFRYYIPFFLVMILLGFPLLTERTIEINQGKHVSIRWPLVMLWAIVLFYVPLFGLNLPLIEDPSVKTDTLHNNRQAPLNRLVYKLTSECNKECASICNDTLIELTKGANLTCDK